MSEQGLSRRRALLAGSALIVGITAGPMAIPQASAQEKIGQADAQYQVAPKGGQRCAGCANFQAPNACKFVQGDISPNGWCQLFNPKT